VTVFDVPAVDPDASERWSRALGDYTVARKLGRCSQDLGEPPEGCGLVDHHQDAFGRPVSVRRNRPAERILVMIDEAAALGRFSEILTASAELPGRSLASGSTAGTSNTVTISAVLRMVSAPACP
jgi:hypothetical protein